LGFIVVFLFSLVLKPDPPSVENGEGPFDVECLPQL
jgi:hypothetical protein